MGTLYKDLERYLQKLKLENKRESTIRTYRSRIIFFLDWLYKSRRKLGPEAVIDFVTYISEGLKLKPNSIKSYMMALRGFLDYMDVPQPKLKAPRIPKTPPKFLEVEELRRLHRSIGDPMIRAMVSVCYSTAMRESELRTRRYKDFKLEGKKARVFVAGKTGPETDAWLPLNETAVADLKTWLKMHEPWSPNDYVFFFGPKERTRPMGQRVALDKFYKALKDAGLSKRGWHQLRHSRATHLRASGVALEDIGDLLRHTSLATTKIYSHTDTEKLRDKLKDTDFLGRQKKRKKR